MRVAVAVVVALLFVPAAVSAGSQPAVYYLRDSEMGAATDGELNATVPNATQPSVRAVPVGATAALPVRFQTGDAEHLPRLVGPVYVALWVGPSPVVAGNLTVTLVAIKGTDVRPLVNASLPLDVNASKLPDPTSVSPPTPEVPPSDPQAYAAYLALYVLGKVVPAVQPPPKLLLLGVLDEEIAADEQLALEFSITQGGSPLPVPAGAFGSIQYDAATSPSLLYAPWYSPDPQVVSSWQPMPPRRSSPSANAPPSPSEGAEAEEEGGQGVPGPEFLLLAVAIGAVAYARRRN